MVHAMITLLTRAPFDRPLILNDITDSELESLLCRLGLFRGQTFIRENEEVLLRPIRLRGPSGNVVLGAQMAMRVIVHLDDGRRMPLTDMTAGQSGHIEGTTCSIHLEKSLDILGLHEGERITYLRQLPRMDYTVIVGNNKKQRIPEGTAAKIWGRIGGPAPMQFVSAGKGQPFAVEKILGGTRSKETLGQKGISPGKTIVLDAVAPAQVFTMAVHEPVVITTDDGLHLHLRTGQANQIVVEVVNR